MPSHSSWILAAVLAIAYNGGVAAQTRTPPDPGAAANVRQSQQYEQALHSNPGFRAKRMQQECGPVTDPELHASCVASFGGVAVERAAAPGIGGEAAEARFRLREAGYSHISGLTQDGGGNWTGTAFRGGQNFSVRVDSGGNVVPP
jgi:hypothetical protein